MFQIRKSHERGQANHGWLISQHTFSFASYHDPVHMGFRSLRVINEDIVGPNQGFGTHGHQNMEIISYVISGALQHKDSMGSGSVMHPGDVQYMSAGRGVQHSEFNASTLEHVHFLQIWILPNQRNTQPRYEQKHFGTQRKNTLCCIASPTGIDQSISILQNTFLYACEMISPTKCTHLLQNNRSCWIQLISGNLCINQEHILRAGDGCAITDEKKLSLETENHAHFLLFDLE